MSCCEQPGLRSVDMMLNELLAQAPLPHRKQSVSLTQALGRVLAASVTARVSVPPYDNSAVDGYAFNTEDLSDASCTLPLSQRIPAGAVPESLTPGTAARIFTGATIPLGANAVAMQEDCETHENKVTLPRNTEVHQNIRPRGQDIREGDVVIEAGKTLRPQELGLLASIGIASVEVYTPIKVAIISSGDELAEPGQPLAAGKIFNSNRYQLHGLLHSLGCEIVDLGIIKDTLAATREALLDAAQQADIIITSGGVSVGEEDHIKTAITELGELNLWKLAIKPGKPFAFGKIHNTPILGLPGNPGAVFVTFCILARPFLLRMQGATRTTPQSYSLPLGFSLRKPGTRREFLRARITHCDNKAVISKHPNQSSGVLSSAVWGEGLAIIPENTAPGEGDFVEFIPFTELFNA